MGLIPNTAEASAQQPDGRNTNNKYKPSPKLDNHISNKNPHNQTGQQRYRI
jgi:hypothetical protein